MSPSGTAEGQLPDQTPNTLQPVLGDNRNSPGPRCAQWEESLSGRAGKEKSQVSFKPDSSPKHSPREGHLLKGRSPAGRDCKAEGWAPPSPHHHLFLQTSQLPHDTFPRTLI